MANPKVSAMKYQKQNTIKEARLAKGQNPQTGAKIEDPAVLAKLRAEWEAKKPKKKAKEK